MQSSLKVIVVDRLKAIVGAGGWIDDAQSLEPYLTEWRGRYRGRSPLLIAPSSTAEVSASIKVCAEHGVGIVPQGGNTGLCGGAIPDESNEQILLSLNRMNNIRHTDVDDFSMVVDAGCTLQKIQRVAADLDLFFPLSLAAEGSCQIGGNLSTNAGGINVLRYGTARAQVLGLEVVLADGRIIDGLRSLRKDTAGYDLKQIFIGAEGTLGVITAACLKLYPRPKHCNTIFVAIDSAAAAVRLLGRMRALLGESPQAFELISSRAMRIAERYDSTLRNPFDTASDWYVLTTVNFETSALENLLMSEIETNGIIEAIVAKNEAEAEKMWRLRHSISAAQKNEGASIKHDVAVPVSRVGEFIVSVEFGIAEISPRARVVAFGHVGDGNIHLNVSQPKTQSIDLFLEDQSAITDFVYRTVDRFSGTFSAEHGIGIARKEHLQEFRSETELSVMRAIKSSLDPQGIMNPGKVL